MLNHSSIIAACLLLLTGCAVHEGVPAEVVEPTPAPAAFISPPVPVSHAYEVDIDPAFSDDDIETLLASTFNMVSDRAGSKLRVPGAP